jgi:hypothetical protein
LGRKKEAPTGGVGPSAAQKKEKGRRGAGLLREGEKWAGGPVGLKGKGCGHSFFFSFSNTNKTNLLNSNFIQIFFKLLHKIL